MPLEEYRKKRDFSKTSEPVAEVQSTGKESIFVVQKHQARIAGQGIEHIAVNGSFIAELVHNQIVGIGLALKLSIADAGYATVLSAEDRMRGRVAAVRDDRDLNTRGHGRKEPLNVLGQARARRAHRREQSDAHDPTARATG